MKENYLAIPLGKIEIGEADRMYTFYTREKGLIRTKARGIRKAQARLAPHVENFILAHITIAQNYGSGTLAGGITEKSFTQLRTDYESLLLLEEMRKVLIQLMRGEERDERAFFLLVTFLTIADHACSEGVQRTSYLMDCFLMQLFDHLGYRIPLKSCAQCSCTIQESEHAFNIYHGGILCSDCARQKKNNLTLHIDTLKVLRLIGQFDLEHLQKIEVTSIVTKQLRLLTVHISEWIMR